MWTAWAAPSTAARICGNTSNHAYPSCTPSMNISEVSALASYAPFTGGCNNKAWIVLEQSPFGYGAASCMIQAPVQASCKPPMMAHAFSRESKYVEMMQGMKREKRCSTPLQSLAGYCWIQAEHPVVGLQNTKGIKDARTRASHASTKQQSPRKAYMSSYIARLPEDLCWLMYVWRLKTLHCSMHTYCRLSLLCCRLDRKCLLS